MTERRVWNGLTGLPLVVQLIGLILGALVVAQLVTLVLTIVFPPAPPRQYALKEIAVALHSSGDTADFGRVVQSGPPDLSGRGWFVSDVARARLAAMLRAPVSHVALGFYTQLPVGGNVDAVAPPSRLPADAERLQTSTIEETGLPAQLMPASLFVLKGTTPTAMIAMLQQMPAGPPGGGFPGGGFPGGHPGGGFPGPGLPGGGFPQSLPRSMPQSPPRSLPSAEEMTTRPQQQPSQGAQTQTAAPAGAVADRSIQTVTPTTGSPVGATQPNAVLRSDAQPVGGDPSGRPSLAPGGLSGAGGFATSGRSPAAATSFRAPPNPSPSARSSVATRADGGATSAVTSLNARAVEPEQTMSTETGTDRSQPASSSTTAKSSSSTIASLAPPIGRPVPLVHPLGGLFSLIRSPYVEGDFVAGARLADGRWAVVFPHPEGFPNAWQRRVGLWFLLSLLAVAPVAWLFARRIVVPLGEFAHAADVLGRDPAAAVLPLRGPAEIGRAAHAFNQMQSRLRSFVDDRAAMIGAISHDLRTPLTRLRFRIEDVPDEQQDGLRGEVAAMEEMISSVISYMRDASTPNARERCDLADLVDDVVESASLIGGNVSTTRVDHAMVDIDALGVRRVLDNLLTNAIKYGGGHARVGLRVTQGSAIADIVDDGPGVPELELERVFEPFYRSEDARRSGREGSGLGLAVCRSIARAHGGDVALFRSRDGFTARVTLPLAFEPDRQAA